MNQYFSLLTPEFITVAMSAVAIMGLVFGSFITALSHRLPTGEDFIYARSYCPHCHHTLKPRDLIPLFSWLSSLGKCRYCHTSISIRYPLIEITTACLFVLIFSLKGPTLETLMLLLLTVLLLTMVIIDLEYKVIPDKLQIALLVLGMVRWGVTATPSLWDMIGGVAVGFLAGFGLRSIFSLWRKREVLGIGDAKFFLIAGLYLGISYYAAFLFLTGILGIFFGLIWRFWKKEKHFPFAPALTISLLSTLLFIQAPLDLKWVISVINSIY